MAETGRIHPVLMIGYEYLVSQPLYARKQLDTYRVQNHEPLINRDLRLYDDEDLIVCNRIHISYRNIQHLFNGGEFLNKIA